MATGLCAVAIIGIVILTYAIGNTLGVDSGRDQVTAREHYEHTKRDNLSACARIEGPAAIECVTEAVEAAQEQSDSRQDLYAQRDMSTWAFWVLIATVITLGITAIGVFFVKRTLEATLQAVEDTGRATVQMVEANRIARAAMIGQLRPNIAIEEPWVRRYASDQPFVFYFTATNRGQGSAHKVRYSFIRTDAAGVRRFDQTLVPITFLGTLGPGGSVNLEDRGQGKELDSEFYFSGFFDYYDDFGTLYYLRFTFRVTRNGIVTVTPNHNDEEKIQKGQNSDS